MVISCAVVVLIATAEDGEKEGEGRWNHAEQIQHLLGVWKEILITKLYMKSEESLEGLGKKNQLNFLENVRKQFSIFQRWEPLWIFFFFPPISRSRPSVLGCLYLTSLVASRTNSFTLQSPRTRQSYSSFPLDISIKMPNLGANNSPLHFCTALW